jgi:Flp pilus assembly protein TadD
MVERRESKRSRRQGQRPPKAGRGKRPDRRWAIGTLIAVCGLTLAAYGGVLDHAFVDFDDPDYVQQNPWVQRHDYAALATMVVSNNYHPVTMWSLAANASDPISPRAFLATNVALHAANAGLVFALTLLLSGRLAVAAFAGLLFGIHPMHVESVAWISERKDVLYAFFFLAAAIAYWRYLERLAWPWLAGAFALFVLSCLSKGMAVVFPFIMVLLDYWKHRSAFTARAMVEKAPFFAAALLFGLIALDVQAGGTFHGLFVPRRHAPEGNGGQPTPESAPAMVASYLWTSDVPRPALRPRGPERTLSLSPRRQSSAAAYVVAPLVFLATIGVALGSVRKAPFLTFGLGWYLVTIATVLQWVPVGEAMMADRYTYVAYVGLLFALGMGLDRLITRRPTLRAAVGTACVLFAAFLFARTVRQVETWKDGETLWTNVIRRYPRSDMAYVSRGNARGQAGKVEEALADLQVARALGSRRGNLYDGLGNAYGSMGNLDSAVVMFDRGLSLEPNMPRTYYNRGIAYLRLGRATDALADFDRAARLQPSLESIIHFPRANALLRLGRYGDAVTEYGHAIDAGTRDPYVYYNRGVARMNLGDAAGAKADMEEAQRLGGGNIPPAP